MGDGRDEIAGTILENALSKIDKDKTFIDKILSRKDAERINTIFTKNKLDRKDITDLLNLCASVEVKLLNYNEFDRYIISVFYTYLARIGEIIQIFSNERQKIERKIAIGELKNTDQRLTKIMDRITEEADELFKFGINCYLLIARSTMSLKATGFMEILSNKFEMLYRDVQTLPKVKEGG